MRCTQNNIFEFKEWELGRSREKRLRGIKTQLKNIKSYYEKHGVPPQEAVLDEFSFRVDLLCCKKYQSVFEIAWELMRFGVMLRELTIRKKYCCFLKDYKEKFESCLHRLEKELALL